jgi:RHS repeat-associated protein
VSTFKDKPALYSPVILTAGEKSATRQKVISGTTYTSSYTYNLASELASLTYPSTRVVQQSYDAIGRLCAIAGQTSGCSTMTNPYASGFGYNTAFEVTGLNYGNGVIAALGYSADRLQLTSLAYTKSSQTLYSLNYFYKQDPTNCPGGTTGNNGQIECIHDNVDNGRSASYTYDPLQRLSTAVTTGSTGYPQWGLSWTYDRYGNRTAQTVTAGQAPGPLTPTDPATNHINDSGYTYDANGNLTVEPLAPSNNYTYDGENRLVSFANGSASGTYTYDGNNLRVKKVSGSTTTVYVFSGSKVIAEYANGSLSKEYVYSGAQLLATIAGSTTTYHHADHLSVRLSTNASGTKVGDQGHFPFGETWYLKNTTTKWQFTSYERDAESGNDYAMTRYHINRVGRFSSPDLLGGSIADPQSLNRYAYVGNDPLNAVDPLGLEDCYPDEAGGCDGGGEGGGGDDGPVIVEVPPEDPPPPDPSRFEICEMYPAICAPFNPPIPPDPLHNRGDVERVNAVLNRIKDAIDPDCLKFLESGQSDILQQVGGLSALIDTITKNDFFGVENLRPNYPDNFAAITGVTTYQLDTVNINGAFFQTGPAKGGVFMVDRGRFSPASPGAQAFILLHELGHLTGALVPDYKTGSNKSDKNAGNNNDKSIDKNCNKTLKHLQ